MAAPDPAPQLSKDSSCTGGGVHTCPSGGPPGSSPRWRGVFFKSLQRLRVLGIVTRASRELAIAERAQFAAQRRLAERDPKLLPDPHCEILQPPANHAMDRRHRPTLDNVHQGLALAVVQLAGVGPWRRSAPNPHTQLRTIGLAKGPLMAVSCSDLAAGGGLGA